MGIFSWIAMGLLAGIVAKVLMPGKDPGGLIVTTLLGIAGAFVGGFLGSRLGLGTLSGFSLGTFLLSTGGAVVLLIVYRLVRRRR